jgi:hypothetical protein
MFGGLRKKMYRQCPLLRVFLDEESSRWGKACSTRAFFVSFWVGEVVFEARSSLARRQVTGGVTTIEGRRSNCAKIG